MALEAVFQQLTSAGIIVLKAFSILWPSGVISDEFGYQSLFGKETKTKLEKAAEI